MLVGTWLSIGLVGLLGGVHCAGMCGGMSTALALHTQPPRVPRVLIIQLGRLCTYTLLGALAGALATVLLHVPGFLRAQQALFLLAQGMLLLLGLYLLGWGRAVRTLERLGEPLWRRIQPLVAHLFPVTSMGRAFVLGALWGFLPCGMIYSMLLVAAASADPLSGALTLLVFGLGTLPTVAGMGLGASLLPSWWRTPRVRVLAGGVVFGFGLWGGWRLFQGQLLVAPGALCVSGF